MHQTRSYCGTIRAACQRTKTVERGHRARRGHLENRALVIGSAVLGCPVKGTGNVYQPALRIQSVASCEAVQRSLGTGSRDFEDGTVAVGASILRRAVEDSAGRNQAALWIFSVRATEAVERGQDSLCAEFEHCAEIARPAFIRHPVDVPCSVYGQLAFRFRAVGALRQRTKAIEGGQRPRRRDLEQRAILARTASGGCPVEVAIAGLNQAGIRILTIGAVGQRAEAVDRVQRSSRTNPKHGATAIHPPVRGDSIEIAVRRLNEGRVVGLVAVCFVETCQAGKRVRCSRNARHRQPEYKNARSRPMDKLSFRHRNSS